MTRTVLESRHERLASYSAGAFTGLASLTSVYLDDAGIVDLAGGGVLATILVTLMFLPFVVFVAWKSTVDFWTANWRDEAERADFLTRASLRFWRFAGGTLLVFVPGVFVLTALIL